MAEHRLEPRPALGQHAPLRETVGALTITEVVDVALASLATRRGREADVARIAEALEIALPGPGQASARALWLGPEQWMIEAPFATHEDIVAALKPHFGDAASITEQTDAWLRLDLSGPDLHAAFERLCALDTRAMAPGHATRTVIDHLGCYLICAGAKFTLLGPRSAAGALHHALRTAALSA